MLYTRGPSGEKADLNVLGGGPYCFSLYQGTTHTTKIAGPLELHTSPYLVYAGGTPNGSYANAQGTVWFDSGNSGLNATVCVWGTSIAGSSAKNQTLFVYNSFGYGHAVASFQTSPPVTTNALTCTTHFGLPTHVNGTVAAGTACTAGIAGPTILVIT